MNKIFLKIAIVAFTLAGHNFSVAMMLAFNAMDKSYQDSAIKGASIPLQQRDSFGAKILLENCRKKNESRLLIGPHPTLPKELLPKVVIHSNKNFAKNARLTCKDMCKFVEDTHKPLFSRLNMVRAQYGNSKRISSWSHSYVTSTYKIVNKMLLETFAYALACGDDPQKIEEIATKVKYLPFTHEDGSVVEEDCMRKRISKRNEVYSDFLGIDLMYKKREEALRALARNDPFGCNSAIISTDRWWYGLDQGEKEKYLQFLSGGLCRY